MSKTRWQIALTLPFMPQQYGWFVLELLNAAKRELVGQIKSLVQSV